MRIRGDIPQVVGTGFTVLDRLYADGDFAEEALGGSCGNVLVSLAMLDRAVAPVLALGRDHVGHRLVEEFRDAGADVRYIFLHADRGSPVLAQELDTSTGDHRFSFKCLETEDEFPRFEPIDAAEAARAEPAIGTCSVFYTDRVSVGIVEAMETAHASGAIVYFEPSDVGDADLFERAVRVTSILKYSAERLGHVLDGAVSSSTAVSIVTHGADGLEMRQGPEVRWCRAVIADRVADTCGSGDMVSVGLIDWLLSRRIAEASDLSLAVLLNGVVAGQRLAAENCAYAGARGVFRERGAEYARRVLSHL